MAENSGHWYTTDNRPMHQVANKSKPGEVRATTLRDAKILGLLPSVSAINKIVDKPGLNKWMQTQVVMTAVSMDIAPGESAAEFAKRVVEYGSQESKTAADFGTRVHSLVEHFSNGTLETLGELSPLEWDYLTGVIDWSYKHRMEMVSSEVSFGSVSLGCGGTADWVGVFNEDSAIIDWKTQKTVVGKPVNFYPEFPCQLVAYKKGLGLEPETRLISVVVSNTEPGRVESYIWEDEEEYWERFKAKRLLYYSQEGPGWGLPKVWED